MHRARRAQLRCLSGGARPCAPQTAADGALGCSSTCTGCRALRSNVGGASARWRPLVLIVRPRRPRHSARLGDPTRCAPAELHRAEGTDAEGPLFSPASARSHLRVRPEQEPDLLRTAAQRRQRRYQRVSLSGRYAERGAQPQAAGRRHLSRNARPPQAGRRFARWRVDNRMARVPRDGPTYDFSIAWCCAPCRAADNERKL